MRDEDKPDQSLPEMGSAGTAFLQILFLVSAAMSISANFFLCVANLSVVKIQN